MYRLIIVLLLLATVSQALPTNATVRMATEAYVTNKVAIGVASAVAQAATNTILAIESKVSTNDSTYTQTVAKAGSALQPVNTNGWTVSAHQAWLTSETDPVWASEKAGYVTTASTSGWTVAAHQAWLTSEADPVWASEKAGYVTTTSTSGWTVAAHQAWLMEEVDPSVDSKITSHNTNLTTHATLFGEKVDKTSTNGWTVTSHSGLASLTSLDSYLLLTGGTMTGTLQISRTVGDGAFASVTSGYGFYGLATSGTALYGYSATGKGLYASSGSGVGVRATSTTGIAGLFYDESNTVTIANQTNALVVVGNTLLSGALTVGGTNIITELNGKASSGDMALKYDASNPSKYVDAVAVTNAIAASMSGNLIVQLTTNKTTAYTFAPTNATYLGNCTTTVLPSAGSVSVPIGTNGNYALAWGCTNSTFTSIEGTYADVELYCSENEAGDQTAKVEIYRRDIATDTMTEWGDGGATFTVPASATPQVISSKIWLPPVSTNSFRVWARIKRVGGSATSARLLIVGSGAGTPTHFSMTVPASVPIAIHNADATAHSALKAYRAPFSTYSNLTGIVTITNNLEAPISISGTGSISVAFSGLVAPYPVYFTAQGFSSITFPAGSYLVGGGMWQTNRVNHFVIWQYSTNLYVNPVVTTEIVP